MTKKSLIVAVAAAAFATTSVALAQGAYDNQADDTTMADDSDATTGAAADYEAAGERG